MSNILIQILPLNLFDILLLEGHSKRNTYFSYSSSTHLLTLTPYQWGHCHLGRVHSHSGLGLSDLINTAIFIDIVSSIKYRFFSHEYRFFNFI